MMDSPEFGAGIWMFQQFMDRALAAQRLVLGMLLGTTVGKGV